MCMMQCCRLWILLLCVGFFCFDVTLSAPQIDYTMWCPALETQQNNNSYRHIIPVTCTEGAFFLCFRDDWDVIVRHDTQSYMTAISTCNVLYSEVYTLHHPPTEQENHKLVKLQIRWDERRALGVNTRYWVKLNNTDEYNVFLNETYDSPHTTRGDAGTITTTSTMTTTKQDSMVPILVGSVVPVAVLATVIAIGLVSARRRRTCKSRRDIPLASHQRQHPQTRRTTQPSTAGNDHHQLARHNLTIAVCIPVDASQDDCNATKNNACDALYEQIEDTAGPHCVAAKQIDVLCSSVNRSHNVAGAYSAATETPNEGNHHLQTSSGVQKSEEPASKLQVMYEKRDRNKRTGSDIATVNFSKHKNSTVTNTSDSAGKKIRVPQKALLPPGYNNCVVPAGKRGGVSPSTQRAGHERRDSGIEMQDNDVYF